MELQSQQTDVVEREASNEILWGECVVDTDAVPERVLQMHPGLRLMHHNKQGVVRLERRGDVLYANEEAWQLPKSWEEFYEKFWKTGKASNACLAVALVENPSLIPARFERFGFAFFGSLFEDLQSGRRLAIAQIEKGVHGWRLGVAWLDRHFMHTLLLQEHKATRDLFFRQ